MPSNKAKNFVEDLLAKAGIQINGGAPWKQLGRDLPGKLHVFKYFTRRQVFFSFDPFSQLS